MNFGVMINMKRLSLAIVFACCMLSVAAQEEGARVNPTRSGYTFRSEVRTITEDDEVR